MIPSITELADASSRETVSAIEDIARIALLTPTHGAEQFLSAYEAIRESSNHARAELLGDPLVSSWTRHVERRLAEQGLPLVETREWRDLLAGFGSFALGVAYLDGRSHVQAGRTGQFGELRIPGTDLVFLGSGTPHSLVEVCVDADQTFRIRGGVAIPHRLKTVHGFLVSPAEGGLVPPEGADEGALLVSQTSEDRWEETLSEAIAYLRQVPASLEVCEAFVSTIVPLATGNPEVQRSVSYGLMPGAVFVSETTPRGLAEAIVHEADHQRLYQIDRWGRLLNDDDAQPRLFCSPWRDDPRPLDGLLRGASAFVQVGQFWLHCELEYGRPSKAGSRAVLVLDQALDAARVVARHADLTTEGDWFIKQIIGSAESGLELLKSCPQFATWRDRSRRLRAEHAIKWRARNTRFGLQ